jgi:hypothetical protein
LRISIPYTYLNPYDHVWLRFWCRFRTKLIVGRAKRFASVRRLVAALIHFYMKSVTSQTWVKPCFLPLLGSSACLLLCSSLLSITPLRSFLFFFLPTAPARPPVYRDLISAAPSFRLEGSRGSRTWTSSATWEQDQLEGASSALPPRRYSSSSTPPITNRSRSTSGLRVPNT